jgi:uncharacterized protein YjbI with pentapeptide repeats
MKIVNGQAICFNGAIRESMLTQNCTHFNGMRSYPSTSMKDQATKSSFQWRTEPEIDSERQKFLTECLTIKPNVQQGIYPFKDVKLTRADVEWLLANHENGRGPVDWSDEQQRERLGLDLRGANLRQVNLRGLPLTRMYGGLNRKNWQFTTLEQREVAGVHLEGADLSEAHLERAILQGAHLEGATLRGVHLQEANLFRAYLRGAYLREAHLERTKLRGTSLEAAYLPDAHLDGADLRNAFFDNASNLERISLGDEKSGFASLVDVHWGDVNLSVVNWRHMKILGDEYRARHRELRWGTGTVREKGKRLDEYQAAVRANRQLANAIRAQGMNEEAIPFAYRAQILQRKVLWRQVLWGRATSLQGNETPRSVRQWMQDAWWRILDYGLYLFSRFLDVLAGYGYKPGRTVFIYLFMIACFAFCYSVFGHLLPIEALIFSVTSFHGRGFLPGPFALNSPVTALAALEAVVGLFIEISFIATFTQRFFGR